MGGETLLLFDTVWQHVGSFGAYQWRVLLARLLSVATFASVYLLNSYNLIEPAWKCDGVGAFDHDCAVYDSCLAANKTVEFEYEFRSLIAEWSLVCAQNYIPNVIVTAQNLCSVFGLLIAGPLSDHVGRRPVAITVMLLFFASSCVAASAPSWHVYAVARSLTMFFYGAAASVVFVWCMEQTGPNYNIIFNVFSQWNWPYMVVAVVGWFTRDWRLYLWAITLPVLPVVAFMLAFIEESPRWLVRKGKIESGKATLNRIAALNGKDFRVESEQLDALRSRIGEAPSSDLCSLFATRRRFVFTSLFTFCFVTATAASEVVIMNLGNLGGDPFENFFLLGLCRCVVPPTALWLDWYHPTFGRRKLYTLAFVSVSLCYTLVLLGDIWADVAPEGFVTSFSILAVVTNSFTWLTLYQLVFELYPTLIRNTADAYMAAVTSAASAVVPAILYLRNYWIGLPAVYVLASCAVCLALGLLVFPETKSCDEMDLLLAGGGTSIIVTESEQEIQLARIDGSDDG